MTEQAQATVRWLFEHAVGRLRADARGARGASAKPPPRAATRPRAARVVADYIAGMTDRFALQTRDALRAKA